MEVEQKVNVLEEVKEALSKKEEALKIAKVKECNYIVKLDKVEKVVKSLAIKQNHMPHGHSSRCPCKHYYKLNWLISRPRYYMN